jgi:HSP20 family protein
MPPEVADLANGGCRFATESGSPSGKEGIMNGLTKWGPFKDWDPVQELDEFQSRLHSFFGRSPSRRGEGESSSALWSPAVDIIEDEKEFLVKIEVPEIKKEDVHVTVESNVLTIRGERKFEKEEKGKRYHCCERGYGSFTRSFSLPDRLNASKVRAEFKGGMLKVHVAKSQTARPQEIDVRVE